MVDQVHYGHFTNISLRSALVGFGPKCRFLGEAAKSLEVSNLKNTVGSLSRLAGRSLNDPDVEAEKAFLSVPLIEKDGQIGARVKFQGKEQEFTATQLIAMFLVRAKQTASAELKLPVNDLVLSCPAWYTDAQRRSILDAAEIAGVKVLRLINETTATALGWGITKLDLPSAEEKPRRVAFIDVGHSNYTATIAEFKKGELKIVGTAADRHFGGRNFDQAIMDHFRKVWQDKHKIDIYSNDKARVRVQAAVEKLKKVLSANASAPISVEMVMNDIDVSGFMKRDELEELVAPLLAKATAPVEQALADAKLKAEDIDVVELVGGASRVPALKRAIGDLFQGKTLSYTLNADEAIARGCAFCCAILSPVFRVRDFSIQDIVHHPIEFTWEKSAEIPDEDTSLTVFNKGNAMPSTKILTFYRKQDFDLEAKYAKPEALPGKINPWIGRFSVKGVKPDEKGDFMICKLKARLNLHGVLNIEQGYYVEDQEIEEPVPEEKGDSMETDDKAPKTRKVKKQVRKGDLPISAGTASLSTEVREQYFEQEGNMQSEDKLVAETEDKKNELEGDIYAFRNKVDEPYESNGWSEFASDEEKEKIKAKCEALEVSLKLRITHRSTKQQTNKFHRTGFTRTARTPPRPSTSASTRSSAAPPPPSSSASTSAASRRRTSAAPRPRPRQQRSVRRRRPRGKPTPRPEPPLRPRRRWPTSAPLPRPPSRRTRR
jgi:heat shock protein 4